MFTPDKIKQDLHGLVQGIRNPCDIPSFLLVLPYTRGRFKALTEQCFSLYKEVATLAQDAETGDHSQRLLAIEADYKDLHRKLVLWASGLIVLGCLLALGLLWYYSGFVKEVLKVDDPNRVIAFGIAGAFIYQAATFIVPNAKEKKGIAKVAASWLRVLLSIVVPVFFVALLFTPEGKVGEWKVSPELIAFACGYNAKIAIEILNKIIEKVSKMIDAL